MLLSDLYFRNSYFCCCTGIRKRFIGKSAFVGQFVRFFHLRDIRFDKYGHHKELAVKGCDGRCFVGRFSLFHGRFDKFFDCEMALVKVMAK